MVSVYVSMVVLSLMKALFAAGIILLVEKLFLQFVAINFHEKALADRLEENRKGLKALDRLSNAQPAPSKRSPYTKRGHKSPSASVDLFGIAHHGHNKVGQNGGVDSSPLWSEKGHDSPVEKGPTNSRHAERQRKRKKAMTSVIVDQVCFLSLPLKISFEFA